MSCQRAERGDNPIYKMVPLIAQIEELNTRLRDDAFLGKGTIAVTEIRSMSPSLCAVPGACSIHLDRRLTAGETLESAVAEVKALPAAQGAEVEVLNYETPSYTGLTYPMQKYYPTWLLEEDHGWCARPLRHIARCTMPIQLWTSGSSAPTASAPWELWRADRRLRSR